jgi:predicted RNase H-like HicB family nuclease
MRPDLKGSYIGMFEPDEEGKLWTVWFPDIPHFTCGNNFEHTVRMAQDILYVYVERLMDNDRSLPVPRTFQELFQDDEVKEGIEKGYVLKEVTWRRLNGNFDITICNIPNALMKKHPKGDLDEHDIREIVTGHWKSYQNFDRITLPSSTLMLTSASVLADASAVLLEPSLESRMAEGDATTGSYFGVFVPPFDENSCWMVLLPDFWNFRSSGVDMEDAIFNASESLSVRIAESRRDGEDVPFPSSYEDVLKDEDVILELQHGAIIASVECRPVVLGNNLDVCIPRKILKSLNDSAKAQGRERSHLVIDLLTQHFGD